MVCSCRWVKSMSLDSDSFNHDDASETTPHQYGDNAKMEGELESLTKEEVIMLRKLLLNHRSDLARLLSVLQDNLS